MNTESREERDEIKARAGRLPRMQQEAIAAILDRYVAGESLRGMTCSADLGETMMALDRTALVTVDVVMMRETVWTLNVTVEVSDELVGELREMLPKTAV